METPSQGLIICKGCNNAGVPHKFRLLYCDPCGKHREAEYQKVHRERLRKLAKPTLCKVCSKPFDTSQTLGRMGRCPECRAVYHREYIAEHPHLDAGYSRAYRARQGQEYRDYLVERRKAMIAKMSPEELAAFRAAETTKTKRLGAILKNEVFEAYGGWRCVCCGEEERAFLTMDHMENNGSKMRREGIHGHSYQFYRWLKKNGFPSGFQVLCSNCNVGKHKNGGVCPHQAGRNDYPERE